MGNETWCEIGDMPVAWCAHCKGLKTPEEEAKTRQDSIDAFVRSMEE